MKVEKVSLKKISVPENIRLNIRENELAGLMASMKQQGLLQPIGVMKERGSYTYLWGHRRIKAAQKLGWKTIDAHVTLSKDVSEEDAIIINAVENLQRKDVSPFELGRLVSQLSKKGLSIGEISARMGTPRSRLKESLGLFLSTIPQEYQKDVEYIKSNMNKKGKVSASVASYIYASTKRFGGMRVEDKRKLFDLVKKNELSGEQVAHISMLMSGGMSLTKAMDSLNDYVIGAVRLIFNKKKIEKMMEEHELTRTQVVEELIKGKIPYVRGLIN